MKTKSWAIFLVIFTTLLTSAGQILYKKGADNLELTIPALLHNYPLIIGLGVYAVAGALIIISLRGGEVSVLYPIIATSYIWVSFLSIYFLDESMNPWKWLGVLTIMGGIVLIGFGSGKDSSMENVEVP
jgi:drug/metabolite transporter (DMT)-like permease